MTKQTFTGIQTKTAQGNKPVLPSTAPQWMRDAAGRR